MKNIKLREFPVTFGVIIICLIVHLLIQIVPLGLSETEMAIFFGAYYKAFIAAGEWHRMITCGLVHVSIMHWFMNMFSLYILGRAMEKSLGSLRYALLLFGSVLGGSILLYCTGGNTVGVGLSGGLYGLLAAYVYMVAEVGAMKIPQVRNGVIQTVGINLMINFMPGVAWRAHFGGAIAGLLLINVLRKQVLNPDVKRNSVIACLIFCLCAAIAMKERSVIGAEERYLRTDADILLVEKRLGFGSYARYMAQKLDSLYDVDYLEVTLEEA